MKSCCVLHFHSDDERDKIVFYKTTPDLQNYYKIKTAVYKTKTKTKTTVCKTKTDLFGLRPVLS